MFSLNELIGLNLMYNIIKTLTAAASKHSSRMSYALFNQQIRKSIRKLE